MSRGEKVPNSYLVPAEPVMTELVIKKSRFICWIYPVENRQQALAQVATLTEQYSDARHHCWAYIAGPPEGATQIAWSDAGEPQGTAGKPILNVLQHHGVGNILAVVVRYFGGIKLGAGGLVRAYSGATQAAMEALKTTPKVATEVFVIELGYDQESRIKMLMQEYGVELMESTYGVLVCYTLSVPVNELKSFAEHVTSFSKGKLRLKPVT
ncbi:YigZ family protein [Zooshikella harenae]|uniref:YigZ family protein n=1 Tax=Zooshikella harenae TaxID=2827238 RepID=A0ABS5ZAC2_9GAMM|nr:YigZ family protein [Zooshikella harenae]MBU2711008.1 YigZ family protein [Zooshikella harenae]